MKGRRAQLVNAMLALQFIEGRRSTFRAVDLANVLECSRRNAYRWLHAAESLGLVKHLGRCRGWRNVEGMR